MVVQGEGDSVVARKAKRAVDSGLNVIACIGETRASGPRSLSPSADETFNAISAASSGETLEARQGGQTLEVLSRQLRVKRKGLFSSERNTTKPNRKGGLFSVKRKHDVSRNCRVNAGAG